jgi:hypothetical protein
MVNHLITISIRVNILLCRRDSHVIKKGDKPMKKRPPVKGFWSWLFGSGWGNAGNSG